MLKTKTINRSVALNTLGSSVLNTTMYVILIFYNRLFVNYNIKERLGLDKRPTKRGFHRFNWNGYYVYR